MQDINTVESLLDMNYFSISYNKNYVDFEVEFFKLKRKKN